MRASLAASVDAAMYWEGPDGDDLLAATVEVRAALEGWAQRACSSSAMGWLSAGFAPATQVSLSWQRGRPGTGALAPSPPADEVLLAWQAEAIRREAEAAERLSEDTIPYSGSWWATPPHHLAVTCAPLFDGTPSGLWFIEDDSGWSRALARRVEVAPGARVFEVDAAEDWARLCREFPLTVTASRRHDWYRATGWAGELVVPDWAAVSMSYDAIHLSYAGYLSGAGLAIPVGEGTASVIAGWNPGATYWLSDKAQPVGEAVEWVSTDDGPRRQA